VNVVDHRFVYNGWNLMAEYYGPYLGGSFPTGGVRHFYWGLDLSGTMQGAGGVGGLLMIQESGSSYLPMDDGNVNVHGLIKASDGSIAAAYEYDAFGNTLRESGAYAASNPFRFSTKYTDLETGLVYYGLRYYSPSLGRFINKDPIEEKGGLNLYAFVGNNAPNRWDYLGMEELGPWAAFRNYFFGSPTPGYRGDPSTPPMLSTPTTLATAVTIKVATDPKTKTAMGATALVVGSAITIVGVATADPPAAGGGMLALYYGSAMLSLTGAGPGVLVGSVSLGQLLRGDYEGAAETLDIHHGNILSTAAAGLDRESGGTRASSVATTVTSAASVMNAADSFASAGSILDQISSFYDMATAAADFSKAVSGATTGPAGTGAATNKVTPAEQAKIDAENARAAGVAEDLNALNVYGINPGTGATSIPTPTKKR